MIFEVTKHVISGESLYRKNEVEIKNDKGARSAFTLIELMVAIPLGALIVYTAVAAFRVASQSITIVNRIATENEIMRCGFSIALNEVDFWQAYDDPFDTTSQKLRAVPIAVKNAPAAAPVRGLPFTRFKDASGIYPQKSSGFAVLSESVLEDETGWDPCAWKANESRGWAWGNLRERVGGANERNFGRYDYYSAVSPRHWQQRQLEGLKNTLGYYGFYDYAPANTPYMAYDISDKNPENWCVSPEWCKSNGVNDSFTMVIRPTQCASDLASRTQCYAPVCPTPNEDAIYATATSTYNSITPYEKNFSTVLISEADDGQSMAGMDLMKFQQLAVNAKNWLPADGRPAHWPSLKVSCTRYITGSRFVCLNRVRMSNAISGESVELTFTAFGTTLRGARQQRHRDEPRWATQRFDGLSSDEPNLDTY
jgi:hypothetical protein